MPEEFVDFICLYCSLLGGVASILTFKGFVHEKLKKIRDAKKRPRSQAPDNGISSRRSVFALPFTPDDYVSVRPSYLVWKKANRKISVYEHFCFGQKRKPIFVDKLSIRDYNIKGRSV